MGDEGGSVLVCVYVCRVVPCVYMPVKTTCNIQVLGEKSLEELREDM